MDDRIINDPHLEIMPDHAGPHYEALRNALTQNEITAEQAVQALNNSWTLNHEARVLAWDQQVAADAAAALEQQEQQQQLQQQQDQAPLDPPQPGDERAEGEKKKLKMKDFDDAASVGNYIAPRPAQYALRRIEDFEYVELWYFTPEGCTDATQLQLTQHDDTFGLTKVDDMVTLKSISSLKASKNVVPDAELSFRQVSMAKNALIPLMTKYQWSAKAINAFAQLFTQLELHHYRQREFGERALITYQARVRREWHDQLKMGSAFNIGILNEDLLQSIYKELLDKAQIRSLNEVGPRHSPHSYSANSPLFFPPPLSSCPSFSLGPFPCTLHLRTMHHAPRTTHHAPCTNAPMHHASPIPIVPDSAAGGSKWPFHAGWSPRPCAHPQAAQFP